MELATVLRDSTFLGICGARSVQGSRCTDIQRLEGHNGRRVAHRKHDDMWLAIVTAEIRSHTALSDAV